jgi:hypothetical protein
MHTGAAGGLDQAVGAGDHVTVRIRPDVVVGPAADDEAQPVGDARAHPVLPRLARPRTSDQQDGWIGRVAEGVDSEIAVSTVHVVAWANEAGRRIIGKLPVERQMGTRRGPPGGELRERRRLAPRPTAPG